MNDGVATVDQFPCCGAVAEITGDPGELRMADAGAVAGLAMPAAERMGLCGVDDVASEEAGAAGECDFHGIALKRNADPRGERASA